MMEGGHYILGTEVDGFEEEFARFTGVKHAVGVANGTDAIELILRGLDIGPGARVVVPSHTAVASASAIERAGAEPLFVDVDPATFTICPRALDDLLRLPSGREVKAVLAVHLYGHPVDWAGLREVVDRHGVVLLEDCAQAHGATINGRPVGSLGRAAAFSLYPTKNLGAIGDGGAITTDDEQLAGRLRSLRQYGWVERYISRSKGVNSRLDEIQAAILRVKLRTLPESIARRQALAGEYRRLLAGIEDLILPVERDGCGHAYHLYVVRSTRRDALLAHLTRAGIPVALHYPAAIHMQPAYAAVAARSPALPQTEEVVRSILSLPLHPYLSPEAVAFVCDSIRAFV
jgi:dTDP-4-amino-4,6-dideoxygalactose transaminase